MKRLALSIVLTYSTMVFAAVPQTELDALIVLYNNTDGDHWTANTNWLVGDPCTNIWFGVTCDGSSNIQRVSLSGNNLAGTIPPELGNLTNLQTLNLYSNQLTGSIPGELGDLTNLQRLDLYNNLLTGSIPGGLGSLANLEFLDLTYNQLTGSIPPELGNLNSLQTLYLYKNELMGSIPPELGNLTNLQTLNLYSNQLTGSIPGELGDLTNLQRLDLYRNHLMGNIPAELGNLSNLQTLYLDGNQLTGSIPDELGEMPNLQTISLSWNGLYTANVSLDEFLDTIQLGGDWSITQTIPPANVSIGGVTDESITLAWDLIEYTGNTGRYRIWCSTHQVGPYIDCGITANKNANSLEVTGLSPDTTYFFVVRTETDSHAVNLNNLVSDPTEVVSVTTTFEGLIFRNGFEEG